MDENIAGVGSNLLPDFRSPMGAAPKGAKRRVDRHFHRTVFGRCGHQLSEGELFTADAGDGCLQRQWNLVVRLRLVGHVGARRRRGEKPGRLARLGLQAGVVRAELGVANGELGRLQEVHRFMIAAVDPTQGVVLLVAVPLHFELAARPLIPNVSDEPR